MATNINTKGTPISRLPREPRTNGVDVSGTKSGRTVKVSLDLLATKEDLANSTTNFKGYHTTLEALLLIHPQTQNKKDFFAWVGSPYPGTVYKVFINGGAWTNTSEKPTQQEIDLAEYAKKTELLHIDSELKGYYTGSVYFDFAAKKCSIGQGYFSDRTLVLVNAHEITWSTTNMQYMYFAPTTQQFYIQDYSLSSINANDIMVGVVDNNGVTTNVRGRQIDRGKYEPIYTQGYLTSNTAILYLDFGDEGGFVLKNDAGGVLSNQGSDYAQMLSGEIISTSPSNSQYIYYNKATKRLESFDYYMKPSKSFVSMWYIGVINPSSKTYNLNALKVLVNGDLITPFSKNQSTQLSNSVYQLRLSKDGFLPQKDWIKKGWTSSLDSGSIYIDTRCIICDTNQLKDINIQVNKIGSVKIYLLDKDLNILKTYDKELTKTSSVVTLEDIEYTQNMYVGVSNNTASVLTLMPADNYGLGKRIDIATKTTYTSNYSYSYQLNTIDFRQTLLGNVRALENRYLPSSDNINWLLSQNDHVILQPKDYYISETIVLKSGQTLQGCYGRTRLILSNGNIALIKALNARGIKICDLELVGTQVDYLFEMNGIIAGENIINTEEEALLFKYMGDEIGIHLTSCEAVVLENLIIRNFTGSGMRLNRVGRDYIYGLKANNIFINNCYNGIYGENEHEFSNYTNFIVSLCQIGITFNSGNLLFSSGMVTRCRIGLMLTEGYNHAHGLISNMEIKHNQIAGIFCNKVVYGELFSAIYLSYCNLILRDCEDIAFDSLKMGKGSVICSHSNEDVTHKNVIATFFSRSTDVIIDNTGNLEIVNMIKLYEK